MKQTTKWTSYTGLRDHLITLQPLRTNVAAPMLFNVEDHESGQGEEEILFEEGELLRLERRNGKQVVVKAKFSSGVPAPHSQQRPVKRDAECHACGKKGHFRRDWRYTRHNDGGPLRPPPPREAAGNLEEGAEYDRRG